MEISISEMNKSLIILLCFVGGCNVKSMALRYADDKANTTIEKENAQLNIPPANTDPNADPMDTLKEDWPFLVAAIYVLIRRRIPQFSNFVEGRKRLPDK